MLSEGSTNDTMDVDTSFLDVYRRGGDEALAAEQERLDQAGEGTAPEDRIDEDRQDRDTDGERGGSATNGGDAPVETPRDAESGPPAALPADPGADPVVDGPSELDEDVPVPGSLRLTDHQAAASRGGGDGMSDGGEDAADPLPRTGFRLGGVPRQPNIKSLPDSIMDVLREQLRSAAVRELGVTDSAARDFADKLSQGTLVTAFLIAHLDLRLEADPATTRAAELLRSRDPLLGSVVVRMQALEAREREQLGLLKALAGQVSEIRETGSVVEQSIAYAIADRTENFLRGSHNTSDAPIGHKAAVMVRDRAREATKKQSRIERERDGRPIR